MYREYFFFGFVNYLVTCARAFVAMCGTFGYELDLSTASAAELLQIKDHIEVFKSIAPIIWKGDLYRLWDPFQVTCVIHLLFFPTM